jgi:hypothetical protein
MRDDGCGTKAAQLAVKVPQSHFPRMWRWMEAGLGLAMLAGAAAPVGATSRSDALVQPRVAAAVPSATVSQFAYWVISSGDNHGLPFMIVDKVAAGVWVFDAKGLFMGSAPVLVGITPGDDSEPGVGDRELSDIPPEQRTTPAGRFVASFGRAAGGRNVLWVDYPTSISLHAVITYHKKERRLERLNSPEPDDNRITFGCINVPAAFYRNTVKTIFSTAHGIVYILPETKAMTEVFPTYRPQPVADQSVASH